MKYRDTLAALTLLAYAALAMLAVASWRAELVTQPEHHSPPCHEQGWRQTEQGRECVRWGWSRK